MSILGDGFRLRDLRRRVAHLLLLAFVARALVPTGYMPDFGAAAGGVFKVVICSTVGAKAIALDADGKPLSEQHGDFHDHPCAFTGLTTVALATFDAIPFIATEFQVSTLIQHLAVQLPPTRAGPQLGSRGPPQHS